MDQVTTAVAPIDRSGGDNVAPEIPFINRNASSPYNQQSPNEGTYTKYAIDTHYSYDSGYRVSPVTVPGLPAVLTRIHAGFEMKTVVWTAERIGAKPVAPDTDTGDPNEILVDRQIVPCNPMQQVDNKVERISGRYTYMLLYPKDLTQSKFPSGTTPVEKETSSQHFYDNKDFSKAWIDASRLRDARVTLGTPLRNP